MGSHAIFVRFKIRDIIPLFSLAILFISKAGGPPSFDRICKDKSKALRFMPRRENQYYDRGGLDEAYQTHSSPEVELWIIFAIVHTYTYIGYSNVLPSSGPT